MFKLSSREEACDDYCIAPSTRRHSLSWRTMTRDARHLWSLQRFRMGYSHSTMTNDERGVRTVLGGIELIE